MNIISRMFVKILKTRNKNGVVSFLVYYKFIFSLLFFIRCKYFDFLDYILYYEMYVCFFRYRNILFIESNFH